MTDKNNNNNNNNDRQGQRKRNKDKDKGQGYFEDVYTIQSLQSICRALFALSLVNAFNHVVIYWISSLFDFISSKVKVKVPKTFILFSY